MQVMGATLRKIGLKEGLVLAIFSLAFAGGLALAFHSVGRDPWQAANVVAPLFIGSLAAAAGVNPVRSPKLVALVAVGALGLMQLVEWAAPLLRHSA